MLLAACKSSEPGSTPSFITLLPGDTALERGASLQFTAIVQDVELDTLPGIPIQWVSHDTTLLTVSASGLVQAGMTPGTTLISGFFPRGHSDTIADTVPIVILDSIVVARAMMAHNPTAAAVSGTQAYISQASASSVVHGNLTSRMFDRPIAVQTLPHGIAVNSTGSRAYVANLMSSTVSMIDLATDSVLGNIIVGAPPYELIVAPGDSILYVTHAQHVQGVRLATRQLFVSFSIPGIGNGLAIAKDSLLYISTHDAGRIVEFNLRTRTVGRTFIVGGVPQKILISPAENELYIANEAGYIQFWNLETGLQAGSNVQLPASAYGIARRATDDLLYAAGEGYIYVIDPISHTLIYSGLVGGSNRQVSFTADGTIGIVANYSGWVDFIK